MGQDKQGCQLKWVTHFRIESVYENKHCFYYSIKKKRFWLGTSGQWNHEKHFPFAIKISSRNRATKSTEYSFSRPQFNYNELLQIAIVVVLHGVKNHCLGRGSNLRYVCSPLSTAKRLLDMSLLPTCILWIIKPSERSVAFQAKVQGWNGFLD